MPEVLEIQDPEAIRLATIISSQTGEAIETIVTAALRDRLRQLHLEDTPVIAGKPKVTVEHLLAIADQIASQVQRPYVDHADLLYDEHGLPK